MVARYFDTSVDRTLLLFYCDFLWESHTQHIDTILIYHAIKYLLPKFFPFTAAEAEPSFSSFEALIHRLYT